MNLEKLYWHRIVVVIELNVPNKILRGDKMTAYNIDVNVIVFSSVDYSVYLFFYNPINGKNLEVKIEKRIIDLGSDIMFLKRVKRILENKDKISRIIKKEIKNDLIKSNRDILAKELDGVKINIKVELWGNYK